jgi:hypothetical protein
MGEILYNSLIYVAGSGLLGANIFGGQKKKMARGPTTPKNARDFLPGTDIKVIMRETGYLHNLLGWGGGLGPSSSKNGMYIKAWKRKVENLSMNVHKRRNKWRVATRVVFYGHGEIADIQSPNL